MGTSPLSLAAEVTRYTHYRDYSDLINPREPDFGVRTWQEIEAEALEGLNAVLNTHPEDEIILNLIGYSRAGVSAIRTAKEAANLRSREKKLVF